MHLDQLKLWFKTYQEKSLFHRYINNDFIEPLLQKLPYRFQVSEIGKSVNGESIYKVQFGTGSKKLLFWSQMHGNESTTTKALFDMFNLFSGDEKVINSILKACTVVVIPILNPDGARAYTRLNANNIDLNRDAQDLSQPESKILRQLFDIFKPDFCFNLHGQRTIFSAGNTNKPATVSFLAPAQDKDCTVTNNRKKAMEVIAEINTTLQIQIPNQVGVYDDAFNINCVGDTFQSHNVPTILFEAGHYVNDYDREKTRIFIFQSLFVSIDYITNHEVSGEFYKPYLKIPMNQKLFYDIIIRNSDKGDIAVQYQERLIDNKIVFIPKIEKISKLNGCYGHKELDANGSKVLFANEAVLKVGDENDFVFVNGEKYALTP
ncbi:M14 family metallopeptidase [Ichthyenterobacterium magnum]|uniref:Zinc carboxypeptidase n=1 Tax=Ichthyenterobacterium magnum TaxID=1230530 RepID=A0A420DM64_9FLAO|nr:M14 metallopeptidase family protein [Ichthyenterobacterium magnum]RKE95288.1 zinc carboxypeptidase [Ichthyenterobacterium magnum]